MTMYAADSGLDARLHARLTSRRPLAERGGSLRGTIELVSGAYPRFLFGGGIGGVLPVFHFHEVTAAFLEPRFRHLAEHGYRTVTTGDIVRFVRGGAALPPRAVALTFDDAWVSQWTVAGPLLRRYGLTATVFVIPARIEEAAACRPTIDEDGAEQPGGPTFATWPELQALHDGGIFDVQSHSRSHSVVFCAPDLAGFVAPGYERLSVMERPLRAAGATVEFVAPSDLGTPLFPTRSRLSDAWRFVPDEGAVARCRQLVADGGGEAFFRREGWDAHLRQALGAAAGRTETAADRSAAIRDELVMARDILQARLGTHAQSIALPWGVAGAETRRALTASGYEAAFAESLWRRRVVASGDDPFGLMRLNGKFVTCLPGRGRRWFFSAV
jgi:peptidoglycan/xylan/chitin deacetylase (PgdA/CDA1 family)